MPLTITRKTNQAVKIGDDIEVRVTRVDGNQVRLLIIAPRSIPIVREELLVARRSGK